MILELAIATCMVLLTVAIHSVGLLALGRLLRERDRRRDDPRINPLSWEGAGLAAGVALGLLTLHGLAIWAYALLFLVLDAIGSLRDAVYYSTISYATIGYTDSPILDEWRLLGAIEGVNGTLLMGWSVAFFVTVMARIIPAGEPGSRNRPPSP